MLALRATGSFFLALSCVCLEMAPGRASDFDPKSASKPAFNVNIDDDGIRRYTFVGKTPTEAEVLPTAPRGLPRSSSSSELARVPEVGLFEALPKTGTNAESIAALEFQYAKVNYFNLKKTDGFLHALLGQRPDLAGLPFRMGLDCRMKEEQAIAFGEALGKSRGAEKLPQVEEALHQPAVAALMQIHGAKENQTDLAKHLSTIPHVDATSALVKLALFSPDPKARASAAQGLKVRRDQDYTETLVSGLRYPWPVVARRAAEAMVRLDRKDLLPRLIEALEAPDPRLPFAGPGESANAAVKVREMVRINHHRNCLLCHPPAHTKVVLHIPEHPQNKVVRELAKQAQEALEKMKQSRDFLLAPAPLPNRSFDSDSPYGRGSEMEHILVRVDITYLRQDFSALLPVENAAPWPDFQRFDFLVRTRAVTAAEAKMVRESVQAESAGTVTPYQRAALYGLRELTGLEATTPAEWRKLLKL